MLRLLHPQTEPAAAGEFDLPAHSRREDPWSIGKTIDVVAIIGTVFGVAVSIGLGTLQINGGLAQLFGIPESALWQLIIIGVVCGLATISVSLGLDKGIKVLSNINIVVAILLLIFIIVLGPTLFMARGIFESLGTYIQQLPQLALWNDTFADTGWQSSWTVFYWAWTITWSPFVGIFIARISRGRTIRQFVIGVLAIPSAFSVVWFGVFGYASFDIEFNQGGGLVDRVVNQGDIPGALFAFLENYPLAGPVSTVAILLVVIFFVTSVDSAALVVDTMNNGHEDFNPLPQRIFWRSRSPWSPQPCSSSPAPVASKRCSRRSSSSDCLSSSSPTSRSMHSCARFAKMQGSCQGCG